MKIKEKMDIDDLYFGVKVRKMSYSRPEDKNKLVTINVFGSCRVKRAVALWVTMPEEERKKHDLISWCFVDVRGRTEYEFIVCPWPYYDEDTIDNSGQKVDTYMMYVEPNAELLEDLVGRVTKSSAQQYLREERARYRR